MALREFTDQEGRRWRAWDILPEHLHPSTRVEDYMQGFFDGWLAFESVDGQERARLTPVPAHWSEASDDELRALLARAERPRPPGRRRSAADVPERPPSGAASREGEEGWSGDSWPAFPAERRPAAPSGTIRTFRYPGGRYWSVNEQVIPLPVPGAPGATQERLVLRFTSGLRALDLLAWPADWFTKSDEELGELLWRAFPRDPAASSAGVHRRRRGDQPSAR